jgi:GNAT superfamily N-acetyltransferase
MGRGLGRRLFDLAAARARELGATRLQWGADPNAVPFYERVGGRVVGEKISEWGRTVPRMEASL